MGRRKPRNIKIREDRLSKLDETKMEVAIWLLAKKKVEDRTRRAQPAPGSIGASRRDRDRPARDPRPPGDLPG